MTDKIAIVDKSKLLTNSISLFLENMFGKQVIARLTFNDDVKDSFEKNTPDIALVAFDHKDEKLVNDVHELMNLFPDTIFVALYNKKDHHHHSTVKKHGFYGFINRVSFINDFKATINALQSMPAA